MFYKPALRSQYCSTHRFAPGTAEKWKNCKKKWKNYKFIWSSKRKPPVKEMQEKRVILFAVRQLLKVDSIEMKIEKKTWFELIISWEWISRLAKQITLGWPSEMIRNLHKKAHQTTSGYWRNLLRDAVQDPDLTKGLPKDRKKYTMFVADRVNHIAEWEKSQSKKKSKSKARRRWKSR